MITIDYKGLWRYHLIIGIITANCGKSHLNQPFKMLFITQVISDDDSGFTQIHVFGESWTNYSSNIPVCATESHPKQQKNTCHPKPEKRGHTRNSLWSPKKGISSFCLAFTSWMWKHIILGHVGCQTFWNHDILTHNTHTHCTGCQDVEQPPPTPTPTPPQPIWGFQAKWSFWTHLFSIEIRPLLSANQLLPKLRNCIGPWGRSITWILLQVVPHPLWPYEKMISPSVCDVYTYVV